MTQLACLPRAELRRIYLGHCLSAPTELEMECNRRAAATWAAWLSVTFRVAISADWIWMSSRLAETPENREWGLTCDKAHIERCDAAWLVGPVMSGGMTIEAQHARSVGVTVFDLTGLHKHRELIEQALTEQGWRFAA